MPGVFVLGRKVNTSGSSLKSSPLTYFKTKLTKRTKLQLYSHFGRHVVAITPLPPWFVLLYI